ncbi:MAG: DNA replication/repair protein RecF [Acidimicrobiales bacterium]
MRLDRLHVHDFRSYRQLEFPLAPGLTALVGRNGQGKTNLLEALYYLAHFRSFRTPTGEVMIRDQQSAAHVRAWGQRVTGEDGREILLEAEINRTGRNRVQLNGRRLARPGLATGQLRVTLFAPDDLAIVKEGPAGRRAWLDELATSLDPRFEAVLSALERVLRQRGALLRQCGGRLDSSAALTLDVWDAKLAPLSEAVMTRRVALVEQLADPLMEAYRALAAAGSTGSGAIAAPCGFGSGDEPLVASYRPSLTPGDALIGLTQARDQDLRRAASTVGPHRDELELLLGRRPVRTHASQGEQRCVALALKLAGHRLVTVEVGFAPLLLLDDVFSELDPQRCDALIANLPAGQTVLTSADRLPRTARADVVYQVSLDHLVEVPAHAVPV